MHWFSIFWKTYELNSSSISGGTHEFFHFWHITKLNKLRHAIVCSAVDSERSSTLFLICVCVMMGIFEVIVEEFRQLFWNFFCKIVDLNMNLGLCANHVSFANLTNKPLPGTTIKTTVLTAQGKQIVLYYIVPLAKSR